MSSLPIIRTAHCLLDGICKEDIPTLEEILDDAVTRHFLPELYTLVGSFEGIIEFLSTFDFYVGNGMGYLWGIRNDSKLAGFIAVMDLYDAPSLFYAMHPTARLQGFMKESISNVVNYLFKNKICSSILTDVYKDNVASVIILQQLGFEIYKEDDNKFYFSKVK